jgi:poly(3-hydroxybutyrate) depolymerase
MLAFQLAESLSSRFAAVVTVEGSFMRGFLKAPPTQMPLMEIHGTSDTTIPANSTTGANYVIGDGVYI